MKSDSLDHYVGGKACTINFANESIPENMKGKYQFDIRLVFIRTFK